jgi:hypothetical protein
VNILLTSLAFFFHLMFVSSRLQQLDPERSVESASSGEAGCVVRSIFSYGYHVTRSIKSSSPPPREVCQYDTYGVEV